MRKAMERVEYSASPRKWNQRTLSTGGSIAKERVD